MPPGWKFGQRGRASKFDQNEAGRPYDQAPASTAPFTTRTRHADCSGWSPQDGPLKGMGAYCDNWGKTVRWCFVDVAYEGPGREFQRESSAYPGYFYAPCYGGEEELLSTMPSHAEDGCSGWSPTSGQFAGKGGSCQRWGWTLPWCYVEPTSEAPGSEFMMYKTELGKWLAPCAPASSGKVPLPQYQPMYHAAASPTPYQAAQPQYGQQGYGYPAGGSMYVGAPGYGAQGSYMRR